MKLFKINEEITELALPFVRYNLLERILDTFDVSLRSVIISMNKAKYFNKISFISVLVYTILSSFLSFKMDYLLSAYTIARLAKTSLEIILLLRVLVKYLPETSI